MVLLYRGSARCSATVVAERVIVTARHCVTEWPAVDRDFDPASLGVYVGVDAPVAAKAQAAPAAVAKTFFYERSGVLPPDIAVIVLDRPVNGAVAPARLHSRATAGDRVMLVGFGQDENGALPDERRRRDVLVNRVQDDTLHVDAVVGGGDSGGAVLDERGALMAVMSNTSSGMTADGSLQQFGELHILSSARSLFDRPEVVAAGRPTAIDAPMEGGTGCGVGNRASFPRMAAGVLLACAFAMWARRRA